jgi:hypothetical protein
VTGIDAGLMPTPAARASTAPAASSTDTLTLRLERATEPQGAATSTCTLALPAAVAEKVNTPTSEGCLRDTNTADRTHTTDRSARLGALGLKA